jgi:hypothetical protein
MTTTARTAFTVNLFSYSRSANPRLPELMDWKAVMEKPISGLFGVAVYRQAFRCEVITESRQDLG